MKLTEIEALVVAEYAYNMTHSIIVKVIIAMTFILCVVTVLILLNSSKFSDKMKKTSIYFYVSYMIIMLALDIASTYMLNQAKECHEQLEANASSEVYTVFVDNEYVGTAKDGNELSVITKEYEPCRTMTDTTTKIMYVETK